MITIVRAGYVLLLSYNPCDIFNYYNVTEMHGLNFKDCEAHPNTKDSSYICGWCNFVPKPNKDYKDGDPKFVFINLNRCNSDVETFGNIMHELMHQSFDIHNEDISKEEEIISWAESEAHEVFKLVKPLTNY